MLTYLLGLSLLTITCITAVAGTWTILLGVPALLLALLTVN